MAKRKGFTLGELLIATLIFGFMISSLATIYATANKHMFQQYRANTVKSSASIAMKDMVNNLMAANRIDYPPYGTAADPCPSGPGNCLAFAFNVDQNRGCRIAPASTPNTTPTWHYFCLSNTVTTECKSGRCLYHHQGTVNPVPSDCSAAGCTNCWTGTYPVASCGGSYGTVTQLSNTVLPGTSGRLFSRRSNEGVYEQDQVKIMLRLYWDPAAMIDPQQPGGSLRTSGRVIDTTLTSNVKVNRSVN